MEQPTSLDLLDRLVAIPSVYTAPSYERITDDIIGLLAPLGVTCHRLPDPSGTRAGLFASVGPSEPGGVLLSAHLDVVPVDGQAWTFDPFQTTVRDGRIYGRGTCDMKGFAACAVHAMIRATRRELRQPLKLALSYDEEAGCVGITDMVDKLEETIGLPDVCLVGEPTQMGLATGHKGKSSFRVEFTGAPGHSAEAPKHLNALHLATDFVSILRRLQDDISLAGYRNPTYKIPHATIHAGRLHGGTALNVVPARAELEFEIRYLSGDDPTEYLRRISREADALVGAVRHSHPSAQITIEQTNAYPGFDAPDGSAAETFFRSVGGTGAPQKVNYGTDGGVLARALDLPVIICGPGNMDQGHKPDEFIELSQMAACDTMMDQILNRLEQGEAVL